MTDFEIVWNGAHKNCDADLLFAGIGRARQLLEESVPMQNGTSARIPVLDVLPFDRDRAMTVGELMARTGSTYSQVSQALFQIRKSGLLETGIAPPRQTQGREPRLYWRKAVVAA